MIDLSQKQERIKEFYSLDFHLLFECEKILMDVKKRLTSKSMRVPYCLRRLYISKGLDYI